MRHGVRTCFGLLAAACAAVTSAGCASSPAPRPARPIVVRGGAASDQVWADPALPPLNTCLNAMATGYGAGVRQAPFSTHPEQAAQEINQAVSDATRGHIPRLVTPDAVASVGWALTSALYMDAAWATPFDPPVDAVRRTERCQERSGHGTGVAAEGQPQYQRVHG